MNRDERRENPAIWKILLTLFFAVLLIGCGSGRDSSSADRIDDFEQLQELVNSREFEIENQWAIPMTGSMVNLIGNPNHIRFKGDSVNIFLPYFGIRHSGGGYEREGGIKYKGPAQNLTLSKDEDDKELILKFETKSGTENYRFLINLFPNGTSSTSVTSSQRSTISYRGYVGNLPEEVK